MLAVKPETQIKVDSIIEDFIAIYLLKIQFWGNSLCTMSFD